MATRPVVQVRYHDTSVRSLRDLHSLGPSALGCVNSVETCTSVYNLHLEYSYNKYCNLIGHFEASNMAT